MPLKTRLVERLIEVKSVEDQSPSVDIEFEFGEERGRNAYVSSLALDRGAKLRSHYSLPSSYQSDVNQNQVKALNCGETQRLHIGYRPSIF
ncbi:hypothetical protein TNCV_323241 [Trichonephila clavipes]|nr:hypothetical protein TNCV_323241 [Trichonephila clavipes]